MAKANDTTKVTDEKKPRLSLVSTADRCAEGAAPDWLVERVTVRDQPVVIGGPYKTLKTSMALDLAVSLATGTKFLNTFGVPRAGKVALFSGDPWQAINETVRRICLAKDYDPEEWECDVLCGFELPRFGSAADRTELRHLVRDNGVGVVIVDPLHLCLGEDRPAGTRTRSARCSPGSRTCAGGPGRPRCSSTTGTRPAAPSGDRDRPRRPGLLRDRRVRPPVAARGAHRASL